MNIIVKQDIQEFVQSFELSEQLLGSTFLITGATGLIGSTLIHCLLALNKGIHIIAPLRNKTKAMNIYDMDERYHIRFIECDLTLFDYDVVGYVDYVIHCAAPTSSKFFVDYPVETFNIIYKGTQALLEYTRKKPVKGFVYLSSLEVYGTILDDSIAITEDVQGYLNPMAVRSCYPMAKRATENLCCLYAIQYGIKIMVARLTQTTGANIAEDDNRVIAQFCRLTAKGENIILHTTGESARPYCYTIDTTSAILYILLRGDSGKAYNVANEETYISAKSMAELLRDNFNKNIKIEYKLNDNMGYAPVTKIRLNAHELMALGWKPRYGLREILSKLIKALK